MLGWLLEVAAGVALIVAGIGLWAVPTDTPIIGRPPLAIGWVLILLGVLILVLSTAARFGLEVQSPLRQKVRSLPGPRLERANDPMPAQATPVPLNSLAPPEPAPRIIVDRTPEQLLANFKGVTAVQGRDRVARYIGNWLRVSGPLSNVLGTHPDSVQVTFQGRSLFEYNNVYAYFREKKWSDRLALLSPGDHIAVIGRIRDLDTQNVHLDDCELES